MDVGKGKRGRGEDGGRADKGGVKGVRDESARMEINEGRS